MTQLNNDIAMEPSTPAVLEQVVELSIHLTGEMYSDSLDDPASLQYQTLSRQFAEKVRAWLAAPPAFDFLYDSPQCYRIWLLAGLTISAALWPVMDALLALILHTLTAVVNCELLGSRSETLILWRTLREAECVENAAPRCVLGIDKLLVKRPHMCGCSPLETASGFLQVLRNFSTFVSVLFLAVHSTHKYGKVKQTHTHTFIAASCTCTYSGFVPLFPNHYFLLPLYSPYPILCRLCVCGGRWVGRKLDLGEDSVSD